MSFFQSTDHVHDVLGGFFRELITDDSMGPKLLASNLVLRFHYRKPNAVLTVDLTGENMDLECGGSEKTPDVEMTMDAETAHQFWLGRVNLPVALARRQITARGPIPKILKLLPVISGAFALYPAYLERAAEA